MSVNLQCSDQTHTGRHTPLHGRTNVFFTTATAKHTTSCALRIQVTCVYDTACVHVSNLCVCTTLRACWVYGYASCVLCLRVWRTGAQRRPSPLSYLHQSIAACVCCSVSVFRHPIPLTQCGRAAVTDKCCQVLVSAADMAGLTGSGNAMVGISICDSMAAGAIPSSIGVMTALPALLIDGNIINGALPASLTELPLSKQLSMGNTIYLAVCLCR